MKYCGDGRRCLGNGFGRQLRLPVCCTIPVDTGTLSAKPNPTIPQFRLKCAVSRSSGMALNAAEHIRITLDQASATAFTFS
jgi:hypothetical protein